MFTTRRTFLKTLVAAVVLSPVASGFCKALDCAVKKPDQWYNIEDPFSPRFTLVNGAWKRIYPSLENGPINPKWVKATHEIRVDVMLDDDGTFPVQISPEVCRVVIFERDQKQVA